MTATLRRTALLTLACVVAVACGGTYHPETPDQAILVDAGEVVAGGQDDGGTGDDTSTAGGEPSVVSPTGPTGTTSGTTGAGSTTGDTTGGATGGSTGASSTTSGTTSTTGSSTTGSASTGEEVRPQRSEIRLGLVAPLSGPIGPIGRAWAEAAQAIVGQANEQGGIDGVPIRLFVEDDKFDPQRGRRLIQQLIDEQQVFGFVGILAPATLEQSIPDIEAAGTPVLPSDGSANSFGSRWLFPSFPICDRNFGGAMDHAIDARGTKDVALLMVTVGAADQCGDHVQAIAEARGATVVYRGSVSPGGSDCQPQVINARSRGADTVLILADNLGIVKCVRFMKQQGWDPHVGVSTNIVDDPGLFEGLGEDAEGIFSTTPFETVNSPEFEALCGQALRRYFPDSPLQFFSITQCIGAHLFIDTLRAIGPDATGEEFVEYLESAPPWDPGGLGPAFDYRPEPNEYVVHLPFDLTRAAEVRDGEWVIISELFQPTIP
ncbi:MAG: ABC transporter substrate-binding protein [Actinobacteria bacterium]|nr:ABC transporter substrate-binding protein [Actinomycetota bacterium]